MATSLINNIKIAGIASAVPKQQRTIANEAAVFGEENAAKIAESTGVQARYIALNEICTSDLCEAAAERLILDLGWEKDSINALIFISQTPDYILPATSCVLQGRLGLSKECAALDVNLGCSGYVYGLWLAASLMNSSNINRVLLLVGDTISKIAAPQDRSVAPLFGDAGTATAIERDVLASPIIFNLGTDGKGWEHLIVPAGGFRQRHTTESAARTEREGGNIRSDEDLFMNGAEIFSFTLSTVPGLVRDALDSAGWTIEVVDAVVMHQANQFMIQHLAKRMKLPMDKVVIALKQFGNTSSASIPLAMTTDLGERLRHGAMKVLLVGFGVGFSWGATTLTCGPLVIPDLIIVEK
jgi:3-oxoacyl-[acyl-carrier-protein] synthase III